MAVLLFKISFERVNILSYLLRHYGYSWQLASGSSFQESAFFFMYLAWRNPGLVKGEKKIANLSFFFFYNVVKVEGAKREGKKGNFHSWRNNFLSAPTVQEVRRNFILAS